MFSMAFDDIAVIFAPFKISYGCLYYVSLSVCEHVKNMSHMKDSQRSRMEKNAEQKDVKERNNEQKRIEERIMHSASTALNWYGYLLQHACNGELQ